MCLIKIDKSDPVTFFEKEPKAGYLIMSFIATIAGERFQQLQEMVAKDLGEKLIQPYCSIHDMTSLSCR